MITIVRKKKISMLILPYVFKLIYAYKNEGDDYFYTL